MDCLTFIAKTNSNIALNQVGLPDAINLQYNKNNTNWVNYTIGNNINLTNGDILAFSGANNHFSKNESNYYKFVMTGKVEAKGNIQSLMNFSDSCTDYCYYYMFANCNSLISAPDLPATTLANYCYYLMFYNCTSLTDAPLLPAKELVNSCYLRMFKECTKLSSIEVAFTEWGGTYDSLDWVYGIADNGIFYKPKSLNENYNTSRIPNDWKIIYNDPITFISKSTSNISLNKTGDPKNINIRYQKNNEIWTDYKFGTIIELDLNDVLSFKGNNNYFSKDCENFYYFKTNGSNVTITGNVLGLTHKEYLQTSNQFNRLFEGTNVDNISKLELPSSNLTPYCYKRLFANCDELITIPSGFLPATKLTLGCYSLMFDNCTFLMDMPLLPAITLTPKCYYRMFRNCLSLDVVPTLPATTLAPNCYKEMFYNCTKINSILVDFTTWNKYHATDMWLTNTKNCTIFIKDEQLEEQFGKNNIPDRSYIIIKNN